MDVLRLKPGVLAVNKQTLGSAAKSRKHPSSCCHLSTLHSQAKSAEEKNIEMVSDSDLAYRLWEVLRTADLNTTTASAVRRALEEEFGIDLSNRKPFIRDQIDLFLDSQLDDKDGVAGDRVDDNAKEEVDEEGPENVKPDDDGDSGSEEDEQSDGKKSEKGRSDKVDNIVKKSVWAFSKPCALSPRLQTFVGVSELARPEVVKKIWAYIRENNLQDPKNKQKILCDEPLRALFRVNSIDMFQMSKALSKHMWPLNEEDVPVQSSQNKKQQRKQGREDSNDKKAKRQKGGGSGFLAPLQLSDALFKFLGTGENALPRAAVVKRMWEYIKQNDLQDPSDKKTVICDEKLKELFGVDSFNGFTVSKFLTAHLIKSQQ